ncbi:hypothetical protein N9045_00470 [bacterium]|nr:hypothetical protein [bacterium]
MPSDHHEWPYYSYWNDEELVEFEDEDQYYEEYDHLEEDEEDYEE